jgi:hypothetical protein
MPSVPQVLESIGTVPKMRHLAALFFAEYRQEGQAVQAVGAGCQDGAALLVAAAQHHADQDSKCESILDSIHHLPTNHDPSAMPSTSTSNASTSPNRDEGALADAVRDCVEAAGWLAGVASQRNLLRAAIYGRSHAPLLVDSALIPQCALHCRVVNSLRRATEVCASRW